MENKTRRPSEPVVLPQLTAKQREVMALIADHRTSKEIAGLLGISESAVNQRIEQIRARLGGVPRGEMARLYRQEFARERALAATFPPTWKKIQVHSERSTGQGAAAEGPSGASTAAPPIAVGDAGPGSQPSHASFPARPGGPGREDFTANWSHLLLIAGLVALGIGLAAIVTEALVGPVGGW